MGRGGAVARAGGLVAASALWAAALLAAPAGAREGAVWVVAPERSEIAFEFELNGKAAEGAFTRFAGEGRFDPEAPEQARLDLRIRAESIDLGLALFTAYAGSEEWFDSDDHPELRFRLDRLAPEGRGVWRAVGALTVKGRTRPAEGLLELDFAGGRARAWGRLEVDRAAYDLGLGPSAGVAEVSRKVAVRFDLAAYPADREGD